MKPFTIHSSLNILTLASLLTNTALASPIPQAEADSVKDLSSKTSATPVSITLSNVRAARPSFTTSWGWPNLVLVSPEGEGEAEVEANVEANVENKAEDKAKAKAKEQPAIYPPPAPYLIPGDIPSSMAASGGVKLADITATSVPAPAQKS